MKYFLVTLNFIEIFSMNNFIDEIIFRVYIFGSAKVNIRLEEICNAICKTLDKMYNEYNFHSVENIYHSLIFEKNDLFKQCRMLKLITEQR